MRAVTMVRGPEPSSLDVSLKSITFHGSGANPSQQDLIASGLKTLEQIQNQFCNAYATIRNLGGEAQPLERLPDSPGELSMSSSTLGRVERAREQSEGWQVLRYPPGAIKPDQELYFETETAAKAWMISQKISAELARKIGAPNSELQIPDLIEQFQAGEIEVHDCVLICAATNPGSRKGSKVADEGFGELARSLKLLSAAASHFPSRAAELYTGPADNSKAQAFLAASDAQPWQVMTDSSSLPAFLDGKGLRDSLRQVQIFPDELSAKSQLVLHALHLGATFPGIEASAGKELSGTHPDGRVLTVKPF